MNRFFQFLPKNHKKQLIRYLTQFKSSSNVRVPGANQIEVKFCHVGASNSTQKPGIYMRLTIIK